MTGANFRERPIAPNDDGLEHGVYLPLELGGPPASRVNRQAKVGLEVERRVERSVLAGLEPRLAHQHGSAPPVLQGESREDVGQALLGQLGPVGSGSGIGLFFSFLVIHFEGCWFESGVAKVYISVFFFSFFC